MTRKFPNLKLDRNQAVDPRRTEDWARRMQGLMSDQIDQVNEIIEQIVTINQTITILNETVEDLEDSLPESDVLWEWNGTDVSQFDSTALITSGQSASISYRSDSATELTGGIALTGTWAGAGGAAVFRLNTGEFEIPDSGRCRVRMRVTKLDNNCNVGVFFHDDAAAASLYGFGVAVYSNAANLRSVRAQGAAGTYVPFELPAATPGFVQMTELSKSPLSGTLLEFELQMKQGSSGNPPLVTIYARELGGGGGGSNNVSGSRTRNGLLSDSEAAPAAGWNNKQITSFGIVLTSRVATTFAAEIADLKILRVT